MNEPMSIEAFQAGRYERGYEYEYFVPTAIDRQWHWADGRINELLERASVRLGELNSFARLVPNIDLFIHLHVTKEAVISSRIEGTQTDMDEALLPKEEIRPEKRDDWIEIQNYTRALNTAILKLEELPLSTRLLKQTHGILMSGARGEHKTPGEFRTSQNWIGGTSLIDAKFVPPAHTYVNELMSDLEKFLHNSDVHVPALIRIGIAHYQFETIHPFLDGNGRIGRLLITLYLVSQKILEKPLLYLSVFFEKNKGLYYDDLTWVREKNDLTAWLKFFLFGIEKTAKEATDTLNAVMKLKAKTEALITATLGRRAASGLTLLNLLFQHPFVAVKDVERITGLSKKASGDLIAAFVDLDVLKEISGNTRNRLYVFEQYLTLFN